MADFLAMLFLLADYDTKSLTLMEHLIFVKTLLLAPSFCLKTLISSFAAFIEMLPCEV
ncbi:hypothetical protein [Microcoleus sp. K5-D4]|uniref:hypothetical protein n=1 Tax=Microcoleus sp. K5-D4 TaxID=2818801 RepID=UPI002FCFE4CA